MKSFAVRSFWIRFADLPPAIRDRAKKQYLLWIENQSHPSIQFKKIGGTLWSARITESYRALALKKDEDFHWFWIGTHREYEKIIKEV